MDKCIIQLSQITQSIIERLHDCSYEEMSDFVEQRQILIDQIPIRIIQQPLTAEEQSQLQELLELDAVIVERMQQLKNEAANWLQQRELAKAQRNAYEAAYSPDSFLMDRKK